MYVDSIKQMEAFVNETYPGAKEVPSEMIRLMASPNLNPDTALAGTNIMVSDIL